MSTAWAQAAGVTFASSRLINLSRQPQVLRSRGVWPSWRIRTGPEEAAVLVEFIAVSITQSEQRVEFKVSKLVLKAPQRLEHDFGKIRHCGRLSRNRR